MTLRGWLTWCKVSLSVRIMGRSWVERCLHDSARGYIGASRAQFGRVREIGRGGGRGCRGAFW
jgi:hypothetical protein